MTIYGNDLAIIIPTYNVEKYISQTVESILKQESKYKIQVIFVDNGSTDKTVNIIEDNLLLYNYMKLYKLGNVGAGAARNEGLKHVDAEYVYFCDSDDYILPGLFDKAIDAMKLNNLDMYLFSGQSFLDVGLNSSKFFPKYNRYNIENVTGKEFLDFSEKNHSYFVSPVMFIIHSSILKKRRTFFPESIIYEDNYFTTMCLLEAKKITSVSDVFYMRRIRNGSVMTSRNEDIEINSLGKLIYLFQLNLKVNEYDIMIIDYLYLNLLNLSEYRSYENRQIFENSKERYKKLRTNKEYYLVLSKYFIKNFLKYTGLIQLLRKILKR